MRHLPLAFRGFTVRAGALADLLALLLIPLPALAWGKAGHRVVVAIAATHLTTEAQAQVAALLDPGLTLADISTWADVRGDVRGDVARISLLSPSSPPQASGPEAPPFAF